MADRRYASRTIRPVVPPMNYGNLDNHLNARQNSRLHITANGELDEEEEEKEDYNDGSEDEEDDEEIRRMSWSQQREEEEEQQRQRRQQQQQQQQQNDDDEQEEEQNEDNISEELIAVEKEISQLEEEHQDLTAILERQMADIAEADRDHSMIHRELQAIYRRMEILKRQQEEEKKRKNEIDDKIKSLCHIVGWQTKEIEYSRIEWSRLMVGRLDGQTKALVIQNQEIASEVAERDFFGKATDELSKEIKLMQHDIQLYEEKIKELGPAITRFEEIERLRQIEVEYFESWRMQREVEIQLGKVELDEHFNNVMNVLESWPNDERNLRENRKMSEELYNARLARLRDRGLNAWA